MSIRGRLGRWWDRMTDDGQVGDLRTGSQLSEPSDSSPKPSFSPRMLHKAASTTFQAFSDSLRSKAQAFYAPADHAEQNHSSPPGLSTPRRSSHRSALWSSVRSRGSRSSRRAKISSQLETDTMLNPEKWPVTPTKTSHSEQWPATSTRTSPSRIGPAPKLSLDIPDLSLRDTQDDSDDVPPSPVAPTAPSCSDRKLPILVSTLHSEPKQLWPSPHMHLTCELPVKAACAAVDTPALAADDQEFQVRAESPITSTSADTKCQNELVAAACPTDPGFREVGEAETLRSSEDTFYTADSGSNTRTSTPIASTARTSISGPPSSTEFLSLITSVKSSKDFKGTYFKGMVVPIGKATHSSKRTLASVGVQPDSQDAFAGEVDLFAGSGIPEPPPTSCANQNIGEGAGKISQAEATHVTAEPSVSDGIPGEISSHSPTATMGPREVWDQSRADRKQRYDSLQSGSSYSDASTDECSDFGSELEMTPNLFRVPTVQQEAMNREDRSPGTKRIFRRRHKSTSPLKFRRKYKFRTNDPEHPLNLDHIGPPTMSEPQHISNGTEPVQMSIEEYMANKQLRLDLRRSRADVLLYEQSNAANASTAPDRIFITSALDPNDELDRRRMNPSYLRRAHMTREELKATPISSSDEDDVDNVSNAATAGGTSCDATLQGTSNSAYEYMDVESWKSSRDISRGRRRERSPSPTNGNSIAGVYGKRNNSTTRQRAVAGAPTPVERSISRFRSPSADYDTLMQEYLDSEHKFPLPQGLRQRLADISMVERRQILAQRDRPRVVHKLEVKGGKLEDAYDSEAEESVKEEDDGWSAALVDAGLEDWMVPAPIPHAGW